MRCQKTADVLPRYEDEKAVPSHSFILGCIGSSGSSHAAGQVMQLTSAERTSYARKPDDFAYFSLRLFCWPIFPHAVRRIIFFFLSDFDTRNARLRLRVLSSTSLSSHPRHLPSWEMYEVPYLFISIACLSISRAPSSSPALKDPC